MSNQAHARTLEPTPAGPPPSPSASKRGEAPGSWLDQIARSPDLDEAIASFVGSINYLRRAGLGDVEIRRLCQINLMYVPRER